MYVLVNYKNENEMKIEGARVITLCGYILDAQRQLTLQLVVGCGRILVHSRFYDCQCYLQK